LDFRFELIVYLALSSFPRYLLSWTNFLPTCAYLIDRLTAYVTVQEKYAL
ncbi:15490_t:CDS:1, partial [Funneliformis mosseae]